MFYYLNRGEGDQVREESGTSALPKVSAQVLDIGMAPGGYTATVFSVFRMRKSHSKQVLSDLMEHTRLDAAATKKTS